MTLALLFALAQGFFSYEDKRSLSAESDYKAELTKTKRIYAEFFSVHQLVRAGSFLVGAILLPLLVTVMVGNTAAPFLLGFAIVLMSVSEFVDRFLFYATVVPLNMAGGFFVGKQR